MIMAPSGAPIPSRPNRRLSPVDPNELGDDLRPNRESWNPVLCQVNHAALCHDDHARPT